MKPAIRVQGLAKSYMIGKQRSGDYRTLRESLMDAAIAPYRRWFSGRGTGNPAEESFWALQDISFEVEPGAVVGIIGRNGAGKSTLLKILSRITEPTKGRAEVRGRIGSLLEVGTGFHPELTGRENIYLNGSILGMSHREISRQFEKIVAFSEIEEFLDTPVKRYSSGMYVRLAFAVAAHLEPEILLIDEVLAVGDATYQRRCVDRMRLLASEGRTIFFVSHNMDLVSRLCSRAIWLDHGKVREEGTATELVEQYLGATRMGEGTNLADMPRKGDGRARFTCVDVIGSNGNGYVHRTGDDLCLRLTVTARAVIQNAAIAVNLCTLSGTKIYSAWTREQNIAVCLQPGSQQFTCMFRNVRFRPGQTIEVAIWLADTDAIDYVVGALRIPVVDSDDTAGVSNSTDQGVVLTRVAWSQE
jgi:lipopolysaccharide transport system ATP-binding protein